MLTEIPHNWRVFDSEKDTSTMPLRSFSHLVAKAPLHKIFSRTEDVASELKHSFSKAVFWSANQTTRLDYFKQNNTTFVVENPTDYSLCFLAFQTVEDIARQISEKMALYGFREATQTLYFSQFDCGAPAFSWCDSLRPGPSFAREYQPDGSIVGMDPRRYAADVLADNRIDENAFNRKDFLAKMLAPFGIGAPFRAPNPSRRDASLYLSKDRIESAFFKNAQFTTDDKDE